MDARASMSCTLDLRHYRELLETARSAGYEWASFDRHPRHGDLFLRHDVALSLEAALETARIEHELGARATYLLMTESAFYNLDSHVGRYAQRQLRQWGHAVGLLAVYPRAELDRRFDRVLAWYRPEPGYVSEPIFGAVNVMEPPYFSEERFRSDDGGCPHSELATGEPDWLQLALQPARWVYRDAHELLDAKRAQWADYLRAAGIEIDE